MKECKRDGRITEGERGERGTKRQRTGRNMWTDRRRNGGRGGEREG